MKKVFLSLTLLLALALSSISAAAPKPAWWKTALVAGLLAGTGLPITVGSSISTALVPRPTGTDLIPYTDLCPAGSFAVNDDVLYDDAPDSLEPLPVCTADQSRRKKMTCWDEKNEILCDTKPQFSDPHALFHKSIHVVTGPSCSGKTTTIKILRDADCIVVPEAATEIITELLAEGIEKPNHLPDFQELVFERYHYRLLQAYFASGQLCSRNYHIITDRNFGDSVGMQQHFGQEFLPVVIEEVATALSSGSYSKTVFYMTELPEELYETTTIRLEDREEALRAGRLIKEAYLSLGFEVVDVPFDTPEKRAIWILEHVLARTPHEISKAELKRSLQKLGAE